MHMEYCDHLLNDYHFVCSSVFLSVGRYLMLGGPTTLIFSLLKKTSLYDFCINLAQVCPFSYGVIHAALL